MFVFEEFVERNRLAELPAGRTTRLRGEYRDPILRTPLVRRPQTSSAPEQPFAENPPCALEAHRSPPIQATVQPPNCQSLNQRRELPPWPERLAECELLRSPSLEADSY